MKHNFSNNHSLNRLPVQSHLAAKNCESLFLGVNPLIQQKYSMRISVNLLEVPTKPKQDKQTEQEQSTHPKKKKPRENRLKCHNVILIQESYRKALTAVLSLTPVELRRKGRGN